jgi:hypothetical protein
MSTDRLCCCCQVYRPDAPARLPNRPPVCEGDRAQVRRDLGEIPDAYALLPGVLASGQGSGEKVSGSRQAPLPLRVDPLDLTLPARAGSVGIPDQVGYLSVATELDFWVRDWADWRGRGERLPEPDVTTMTQWLLVRLDDAFDHPAIDEFAAKVSYLRRTLHRMAGIQPLTHHLPAPCPTCGLTTMVRRDGASYVECDTCGRLWTEEDYRRLCVVLAAEQEVA